MAKLGNVLMLNQKGGNKTNVYEVIYNFLTRKGQNSDNTEGAYERAIRDFFRTMRGKDIEDLTVEDIKFEKTQIEAYQIELKEYGYKGSTVNGAITALKKCYEKLEDNKFPVQSSWFSLERYDEHDSKKYGTLSHEEVLAIIDFVSKTRKGKEKALLIRLAYATAFRKDSLLEMKWSQFEKIDNQWYAKVLGKGNKWSRKKITDSLYNALMEFKAETNRDKIFQLTDKTIKLMMKKIRESFDFGDRWIVFHSFKKASMNEVNRLTGGDLKAIQAHGDHEDVTTSLNSYIEEKKMEDLIAVDIDTHIPLEAFDELTQEQCVALMKSMDRTTQIKLLRKMGAM